MRLEAKKYLYDIAEAARLIADFTAGKAFTDYEGDAMLRSAVERQFAIVGEALALMARLDELLAELITEYRRIITFRNVLAHGYIYIDDRIVWDIVESKLPTLRREAAALLEET